MNYYVIMDRLFSLYLHNLQTIFLTLFYLLIGIHTGRVLCE